MTSAFGAQSELARRNGSASEMSATGVVDSLRAASDLDTSLEWEQKES